jgi:DNA recombination protein RmuC
VDAVVKVGERIIPVDSKFSLENYNRILEAKDPGERKKYESAFVQDLKNRIDETAKYVKPEENTMDFAFMFIPSEAVYYDLLINKVGAVTDDTNTLISYAGTKRVIIVSPTSFLAYLQTVLQGLKNQKISEQAREITKQVERLGKHLFTYQDHMNRLGKNIGTTVSAYNRASKELGKIDKDVLRITGETTGIRTMELEAPHEAVEKDEQTLSQEKMV